MPGEMNTNLKVEDLQMDVMITETYPGKGVLALANVKIGNFVTIRNVRIKKDDYGFTVAMPKTKGNAAGQYQDTVYDPAVVFLYGSVFGGSHRSAKEDCPKLDGMPGGTDQYCAAGTALPYGNSGSPAAVPCRDHHRRNWWRRCETGGSLRSGTWPVSDCHRIDFSTESVNSVAYSENCNYRQKRKTGVSVGSVSFTGNVY